MHHTLANLFLFAYEESYINKIVGENKVGIAKDLDSVFRYQDDCIVFNDNETFNAIWKEIYPTEMQLEITSTDNICTFLDLTIRTDNGRFTYQSYDKRDSFNFQVINYPNLKSNVPLKPTYGVFSSQLIRFCEINDRIDNFVLNIKDLVKKLIDQNFDGVVLKALFKKFCASNLIRWSKFGSDICKVL